MQTQLQADQEEEKGDAQFRNEFQRMIQLHDPENRPQRHPREDVRHDRRHFYELPQESKDRCSHDHKAQIKQECEFVSVHQCKSFRKSKRRSNHEA